MPIFEIEEYSIDLNVSVLEFFTKMGDFERQEMFDMLIEEDYKPIDNYLLSIDQQQFNTAIEKIKSRYYSISKEDEETILKIANKY